MLGLSFVLQIAGLEIELFQEIQCSNKPPDFEAGSKSLPEVATLSRIDSYMKLVCILHMIETVEGVGKGGGGGGGGGVGEGVFCYICLLRYT